MTYRPLILLDNPEINADRVIVSEDGRSLFGLASHELFDKYWHGDDGWEDTTVKYAGRDDLRRLHTFYRSMVPLKGPLGGMASLKAGEYSLVVVTIVDSMVMFHVYNDLNQGWRPKVFANGQTEILRLGFLERGETILVNTTTKLDIYGRHPGQMETDRRDVFYYSRDCKTYAFHVL